MKKVLLAEDDPFILDIYSNKLKQAGYQVDIAVDGSMALEKISQNHPDLLMLDINLPKLDGWGVLKNIRGDAMMRNLKVIVISNIDRKDYPADAASLGVLKFFLKVQTTPDEITACVKEILK